jgi:hypothetical protein
MSHTHYPAADVNTLNKGELIALRIMWRGVVDTLEGTFVSINSKGINLKVDGKVISRSMTTVTHVNRVVTVDDDVPNSPVDLFDDNTTYTTAELAAALKMSTYDLRVELRKLGMSVGKGHKYGLDGIAARHVHQVLNNGG